MNAINVPPIAYKIDTDFFFLTTRGDVVAGFNIDTGMWDMELLMVYFLLFASYGRVCWFEVRMFGEDQCCMERVICLLHILCVPIFFNSQVIRSGRCMRVG